MKIKITFQFNEELQLNQIIAFSCYPVNKTKNIILQNNEILVDAAYVPKKFYSHWSEYSVSNNRLIWDYRLYK